MGVISNIATASRCLYSVSKARPAFPMSPTVWECVCVCGGGRGGGGGGGGQASS